MEEKEHFAAEDCYISAMAHVNEGFTPGDICRELLRFVRKIRKSWNTYKNIFYLDDYDKKNTTLS